MKCRIDTMSCKIKKIIKSVAMNIATITRELYDVDREDRIAQISERKRRTYKFVYHAVNMINTIVLFAINYLIMWIVWYIIMDPPFGKARYTFLSQGVSLRRAVQKPDRKYYRSFYRRHL